MTWDYEIYQCFYEYPSGRHHERSISWCHGTPEDSERSNVTNRGHSLFHVRSVPADGGFTVFRGRWRGRCESACKLGSARHPEQMEHEGEQREKGGSWERTRNSTENRAGGWLDGRKARWDPCPRCDSARAFYRESLRGEPGNYRGAREPTMLPTVEVRAACEARRLAVAR